MVIVGPLAEPVCDKLVMEWPYKFARSLPGWFLDFTHFYLMAALANKNFLPCISFEAFIEVHILELLGFYRTKN